MFFISRRKAQTQIPVIAEERAPGQYDVEVSYTIDETLDSNEILRLMRLDTIDFVEENRLEWGATQVTIQGVSVIVKLLPSYDIAYSVGGYTTFERAEAAAMLSDMRLVAAAEMVF